VRGPRPVFDTTTPTERNSHEAQDHSVHRHRSTLGGRADRSRLRQLRKRLGARGMVELTATVGYYAMIACTLNAFDVEPEPGADLLPV